MAEDDIMELLWHNGQIVRRSQTQIPTSNKLSPPPPPSQILRGSGSGSGEGNGLPPLPQQNLFIQEDEMASWLHYQNFCSAPLYSSVESTQFTQPQIPLSLSPPLPISAPYDQPVARRVENFINLSRLSRVEAGQWIPVVREPMKGSSTAISLSSTTSSSVKPSKFISGVSHNFPVPGLGRKERAVAIETVCGFVGTSYSETEPIHLQPPETEIADNRKQKNREYTIDVPSTPAIYPQIPLSLAQPPPPSVTALYDEPAARRVENFMNFSSLRGNIFTGYRVKAGPWIPVVTEPMQVGSSSLPLFSATGYSVTPSTVTGGVSHTFAVPDLGRKDKAVAIETVCEITGTSSSRTEPILLQPAMETEISDDRALKNREDTIDVSSTPVTLPQIPVSLAPPPPPPISALYDQAAARRVENLMNFSRLRGNMFTGYRVETGSWVPVVTEPMQVGSSAVPLFSATGSSVTPSTVTDGMSHTFAVPDLGGEDKAVAIETVCEITGTSSSRTEPILSQPADDGKQKNREYTIDVSSTPAINPQIPISLAPPPPVSPLYDQAAARRVENFMNFLSLRGNRWIPVVREPSAGPLSSGTGSSVTPSTFIGEISHSFPVPGPCQKDKAVAIEPIHTQPATETENSDNRKRNNREYTVDEVEETREDRGSGSTARKRSRATEMHKLSEKKRREKIKESMKTLQELVPRCKKTDKASMLEDVVDHVKWLRNQLKMICRGGSMMAPMYQAKMQRFMPHSAMGSMCMNQPPFIPFPMQDHMAGAGPSNPVPHHPFPNNQVSDPSRVLFPSQQAGPVSNQPHFPTVGLHQMQQPPPLQNQTASQLSSSQASGSKEPDDQTNQPIG